MRAKIRKTNDAEKRASYLTNTPTRGVTENANAVLMLENTTPLYAGCSRGNSRSTTLCNQPPFSLSRIFTNPHIHIQNNPHRFFPASPVFPLLVPGFDTKVAEDAPEAAAVMAANLSLARSSPDSAALTYHRLDSKGSRRQPMPISVK